MDDSFVEVMKQYNRMCNARIAGCLNCELASTHNGKNITCHNLIIQHPEHAERIIMKWADEHPEPLYPTWGQWQMKMFPGFISSVCPMFLMKVKDCEDITCDKCRSKRIPAEIAEKLGIKPGKEWE